MTKITSRNDSDTRYNHEDMLDSAVRNINLRAERAIELAQEQGDTDKEQLFRQMLEDKNRLVKLFGVETKRGGYIRTATVPDDELRKSMDTIIRPDHAMVEYIMRGYKKG